MNPKKSNIWEYTNFWLIWFGCMEEPRTLYKLQNIWELKGNPLYQEEGELGSKIADIMMKKEFLKEENGEYYSIFNQYFNASKEFFEKEKEPKNIKSINLMEKDKEEFLSFFDNELIRKSFFATNNFKLLGKKFFRKHGFRIPLFITSLFITILYFYEKEVLIKDSMLKDLSSAFTLLSGLSPLINLMDEYLKSCYEDWSLNDLKKFESLLKTEYGKNIKKRTEEKLTHSLLKRLFEGYYKLKGKGLIK